MPLNSHRNGVASIIGGVFVILIILAGYTFFAMNNTMTNELEDVKRDMDKLDEARSEENILIDVDAGSQITVTNLGGELVAVRYIATASSVGEDYTFYDLKSLGPDRYLNPREPLPTSITVSGVDYTIVVITDRGSITKAYAP